MKKILSLLSVMTISATAVPTTIAASSYQKQENKLESSEKISSQTNNLEKLNRNKRGLWDKVNKAWTDNIWDPAKNKVIDPVNKVWTDNVFDPAKKVTQNCLDNMANMNKNALKRGFKANGVKNTGLEIGKGYAEVCIKANSNILD